MVFTGGQEVYKCLYLMESRLFAEFFARRSDASCPIYGRIDIDSPAQEKVIQAIEAGEYRYDLKYRLVESPSYLWLTHDISID